MKCTACKKDSGDLFSHGRDNLCKRCFIDKPKRPPGRPPNKEKNAQVRFTAPVDVVNWFRLKGNVDAVIAFVKRRLKNERG